MTTDAPALQSARTLAALGRSREARATLDAVLAHDPAHPDALLVLGDLLLHERDAPGALAAAARAVEAAPERADARTLQARALHALGRDQDGLAAALAAEALLARPENFRQVAPVYLTIVWCLRALGRTREAFQAAERGLARTPDAVLAEWASVVEQELADGEQERC